MTTNLTLDSGTKRLLELASEPYSSDEDIQTILSIINTVAPSLLDGLTEGSCNRIARGLEVRCYPRNEVLFRQGDPPDAYYTVIRGAVSIYALSGDSSACSTTDAREGKFLCQLPPGSSFGELSFNANGMHSPRNAGVVSDGSHGQSKAMVRTDGSRFSSLVEVEASDVAVLLCIPEALYMKELFPRHAAKHLTKEKLDLLRSSFLFQHWTTDQLIKLAYAMKKKSYTDGAVIASEGEHIEFLYIIQRGRVMVRSAVKGGATISNNKSSTSKRPLDSAQDSNNNKNIPSESPQNVDIAILGDGDVIGLVEAATKSKKMRRTIVAATETTDTFVVPMYKFLHTFLAHQEKTKKLVHKMADKRRHWESLRLDYAIKFPSMPRKLPKDWKQMSLYVLHPDSVLTAVERRQQKEKQALVSRKLREARSLYRVAMTETYHVKSTEELAKAEALCQEARDGASGAFRCEKKKSSFLKEVAGVEEMIRSIAR